MPASAAPATPQADLIERLTAEGLIPLAEVARRLGHLRGTRPVHSSTIGRWVMAGRLLPDGRRLRLEAVRIHGQWVTSWPATVRYLAEQQPAPAPEVGAGPRSPLAREKAAEAAGRALEEMGA
jgi:hypothetical protein